MGVSYAAQIIILLHRREMEAVPLSFRQLIISKPHIGDGRVFMVCFKVIINIRRR